MGDFSIICDKQEILDKNYWKLNEKKKEQFIHSSIGFLSEYISEHWITKLKEAENITEELTTQNSKVTSMEDVFKYSHQKNTSGFAFNVPSKKTTQSKSSKIDKK